ncbi:MAG: isoleucine--tRNA ligase [Cyclobacteriaceae bacterium]|nr:isoleucine--tRNA ligase [Cyclobacteriaceae bacterium]
MKQKKYKEYKNQDLAAMADEVLSWWKENAIFEKSIEDKEGKKSFTFYEGPPSANGTPGIHHVMARAVKDIFCRFKTMKGYTVKRKGGWDTHGLPVELQVEKELGIRKDDIGKTITVDEYNKKCKETVMKYKDEWDLLTEKMGYWVDLENPYVTFEPKYIETLWYLLKEFYKKDLLYRGYTIQPYSPAAGTGLSSHELNQPGTYKEVKDTSITAQFKLVGEDNTYILAWTTTPWTLAANNGLAIGAKITYVKVLTFNPYTHLPVHVILAKDRVSYYFNDKAKDLPIEDYKPGDKLIPFQIIKEMKGSELVGLDYEQLLPYIPLEKPAFTVVEGDFVTTEDGTGIVHISKTFGADDYRVSVQNNMPGVFVKDEDGNDVPIVDKEGKYVKEIVDFAGIYVKNEYYPEGKAPEKSLDVQIAIKLKEENRAFLVEKYEHSYPHCWRTDKPILYYPLNSWFIKTTKLKDRLVELNNTINWKPASTGQGRFGNWLENLVDWNLSRSRFWGTPLPIWENEDKSEEKCIGSLDELREEVKKSIEHGFMKENIGEDFDLHRPYVDDIVLVSSTGAPMNRVPDLIDVWFDSGAMPYAQWHYPFENMEEFEKNFPADFIAEGVDQTRGWFFTLHAIAVLLFDKVAFKNVIANGLVLDKDGNKMSKRLGNAVNPFETIAKYGPDATRWYMISNANPWDNLKFNVAGVDESKRRFFGTLQNTYSFFALYSNLDGFKYDEDVIPMEERTESDRWILSKLNTTIKQVDEAFGQYEPTRAARLIQSFTIDDLSNWYVRLNRKRFWKGEYSSDKIAAYQTLYDCLIEIARMASPIAPFYSETLFLDLNSVTGKDKAESVHLSDFPGYDESKIDQNLEEKMYLAQVISSLVHSLRRKHKIKVRQPLGKILLPRISKHFEEQVQAVSDIILNEVNIKEIEYVGDDSGILVKKVKANFRRLGQLYGKQTSTIANYIQNLSQEQLVELENSGNLSASIEGTEYSITFEDVEIFYEDIPGWSVASEGNVTVALDCTITDDLKKEGLARDFINRIQNLRKDQGLDVQDKITINVSSDSELLTDSLLVHQTYICNETQAVNIVINKIENGEEFDIDGINLKVKIETK